MEQILKPQQYLSELILPVRPPYIFDKVFKDYVQDFEGIRDSIDVIEPIMVDFLEKVKKQRYNLDLVRGGFYNILDPSLRTEEVRRVFTGLAARNISNPEFPKIGLWQQLANSFDVDLYLRKLNDAGEVVTIISQEDTQWLGHQFVETFLTGLINDHCPGGDGGYILSEETNSRLDSNGNVITYKISLIETTASTGEKTQLVLEEETSVDNKGDIINHKFIVTKDKYKYIVSWGQIPTNKAITAGKIVVTDAKDRNQNPLIIVDVGLDTAWKANKRAGDLCDKKTGLRASLSAGYQDSNKYLKFEIPSGVYETEQDMLDANRAALHAQGSFVEADLDPENIWGELERIMRSIRSEIFLNKIIDSEEDVTNIFSSDRHGWDRIKAVISAAKDIKAKSSIPIYYQEIFIKEMLVMLEADPYLTLLISKQCGLLNLFPSFEKANIPDLMKRTAFYTFKREEDGITVNERYVEESQRNPELFIRERKKWLEAKKRYSGLKMFYEAAKTNPQQRSSTEYELTWDIARWYYDYFESINTGAFSFSDGVKIEQTLWSAAEVLPILSLVDRFAKEYSIIPEIPRADQLEITHWSLGSGRDRETRTLLAAYCKIRAHIQDLVVHNVGHIDLRTIQIDSKKYKNEVIIMLYTTGIIRPVYLDVSLIYIEISPPFNIENIKLWEIGDPGKLENYYSRYKRLADPRIKDIVDIAWTRLATTTYPETIAEKSRAINSLLDDDKKTRHLCISESEIIRRSLRLGHKYVHDVCKLYYPDPLLCIPRPIPQDHLLSLDEWLKTNL